MEPSTSSLDVGLVAEAIATVRKRNAAPYDGVLGKLPDWTPPQMRHEFEAARNTLLESAPDSVVRLGFLAQRIMWDEENINAGFRSTPAYLPEHEKDLRTLYRIWRVVQMPEEERYRYLAGEQGVQAIGTTAVENARPEIAAEAARKNARKAGSAPRNVDRNARIMAASRQGEAPKRIAADEKLDASTVRRIIQKANAN